MNSHPLSAVALALEDMAHNLRGQIPGTASTAVPGTGIVAGVSLGSATQAVQKAPLSIEVIEKRLHGLVDTLNTCASHLDLHVNSLTGQPPVDGGQSSKGPAVLDGALARLADLLDHAETLSTSLIIGLDRMNTVTKAIDH